MAWFGQAFPVDNPNVTLLKLPCGRVLEDACIWKDFMQDVLGVDPAEFWETIQQYPTHDHSEIAFHPEGDDIKKIPGTHPALNNRGSKIGRNKIWLQSDYEKGLLKYTYTGWQHRIAYASKNIEKAPKVLELVNKLNEGLKIKHNHWIITEYETKDHKIPFHSDDDKHFEDNSYFVVLKLGEPRKFQFYMPPTDENKNPKAFYSEELSAGTAIFVRTKAGGLDANSVVLHGVPKMRKAVGRSGSIVGRSITTFVEWDEQKKEIAKSERERIKRNARKLKKKT